MIAAGIYILLTLLNLLELYVLVQSVKELTAALTSQDEKSFQSEKPALHVAVDQPDGVAPDASDFAVTGKPLKPSWRIRKRELEAASRTKRKQLESFQEID